MRIPQSHDHLQGPSQESTGSGNPSASTCGQIVRSRAYTDSQGAFLLIEDQDRNQAFNEARATPWLLSWNGDSRETTSVELRISFKGALLVFYYCVTKCHKTSSSKHKCIPSHFSWVRNLGTS